ncbi:MAG: extracellular solute-binding protein, partial [Chloroflexota bacterium]|nr:extracellular solute-binding protein [Chloroflexota bacterium]
MVRKKMQWPAILAVLMLMMGMMPAGGSNSYAQATSRTFPETGRTVKGRFLQYWNENGGLAQQGFPITEELQEKSDIDGKVYTMQYFERAVFEMHPENKAPYDVLLTLLGRLEYEKRYGKAGAPGQKASTDNATKFNETGKTVGGKFLAYWKSHGGLPQQGYPISEEFQEKSALNGKTYTVQYFERAVFELHPENQPPFDVLLAQLGTFQDQLKHGVAGPTLNKNVTGNIEMWHFWSSPVRRNAIRRVIGLCTAQLPGIKVNDVAKPFGDIWTANLTAVAAGSGMPDVIVSDRPKLPQDAANNVYTDLQALVDRDGVKAAAYWPFTWQQTLYKGHTYGIP